jgi:S-formylglutathione hydrolase FrmB
MACVEAHRGAGQPAKVAPFAGGAKRLSEKAPQATFSNRRGGCVAMMKTLAVAALLAISAASVAFSADELKQPGPRQNGARYERVSVHADSLVGNLEGDSPDRKVSVYLPPSYDKNKSMRFPVLYLLHGYTDSDERWFGLKGKHFVSVQDAVDRAYASGAKEMIIVMPDAFTKYAGSMYSSSATIGNWEAFVTSELVSYIDKHYRTVAQRESRGLAGHSMGGYGTMRLGMKYPGIFSSLYALSPCCMSPNLTPPVEWMAKAEKINTDAEFEAADFGTKAMIASAAAWSPNPAKGPKFYDLPVENGALVPQLVGQWAANAPLAMVPQYIPNLKTYRAIMIDAGDKDVPIVDTVKALDQMLTTFGVAHKAETYSGNHVDHIEERLEKNVMPFFSKALK